MTTKKLQPDGTRGKVKAMKWRRGLGRIRLCDRSLNRHGYRKGQIVLIKLDGKPKDGDLCAAFTPWGELVVRSYYRKASGDVRLTTEARGEVPQVFAPRALMVFGPVVGMEKGGH